MFEPRESKFVILILLNIDLFSSVNMHISGVFTCKDRRQKTVRKQSPYVTYVKQVCFSYIPGNVSQKTQFELL